MGTKLLSFLTKTPWIDVVPLFSLLRYLVILYVVNFPEWINHIYRGALMTGVFILTNGACIFCLVFSHVIHSWHSIKMQKNDCLTSKASLMFKQMLFRTVIWFFFRLCTNHKIILSCNTENAINMKFVSRTKYLISQKRTWATRDNFDKFFIIKSI